jgi:predicted enzyme related to lactoylglutathione lyase
VSLPKPCVVLFVDDVQQLTAFYRELADMSVEHEAPDHAVLETAGVQLVIHGIRRRPEDEAAGPEAFGVRDDSYWKLCLPVAGIAAARATAERHGGRILPVDREWEARGFRACDGHDPEGNVLQVRMSI